MTTFIIDYIETTAPKKGCIWMFKSGQCAPAAGKRRPTTAEEIQKTAHADVRH